MSSPKRVARIAGVLYLIVALCGFFAHFYARAAVRVPGDAAATTENIVAHATLFRLGFVADLLTATSSILVAMTLYRLFKHVNKDVAAALVVFMAIGTGMILVNLIFHFAALLVATDASYAAAPGTGGSDALVLLLVDMHWYGYAIGGIMFGLWLLPMGYLVYTSGMFPRALGVVLMIACFGYLLDTLTRFLLPDLGETLSAILTTPAAVAELWMVGYLLVIGVRTPKATRPAPVTP
ncbi:DUF4386 domain-containing protein [Streptosporangium carneum]|uniref:DUF4386 domain-containing protein n=1 Tax=Streptosporangium carneum TaxID=47481 RepID=A0A9W6HUQ6_9ACTN|nr:DUF4386 domain-containing protein [Streptosporangium carneum]GLK06690.1 hypothetical protein GCM10017600_00950 [Streptosporangium carneum]